MKELPRTKTSGRFKNVVAVFACIELGDDMIHVRTAVKEIMTYLQMIRQKNVVVIPFVHLSSNIAQPQDAIRNINEMIHSLRSAGADVCEASFGFHKDFELHSFRAYGHPGSVCFRSISSERGQTN